MVCVIENMKIKESVLVKEEMKCLGVPFLGDISFDNSIEEAIGNVDKLLKSNFAMDVEKIILPSILKN